MISPFASGVCSSLCFDFWRADQYCFQSDERLPLLAALSNTVVAWAADPVSAIPPAGPWSAPENKETKSEVRDLGTSVVIKGDVTASEDLTIEGRLEGNIELIDHILTISSHAMVKAQIVARTVTIRGIVTGNVKASQKVDIRATGSLEGDVIAPRIALVEGAYSRGKVGDVIWA